MQNEKLKSLVERIQSAEKDSKVELANIEYTLQPAWASRKNQAIEQLKGLKNAYATEMIQKALYIYLQGDKDSVNKFAYIAEKEAFTTTIAGDDLFSSLGNKVYASLGPDKKAGTFQGSLLNEEMVALDPERFIKMSLIDSLPIEFFKKINSVSEAETWVRNYLTCYLGLDFLKSRIQDHVVDSAVKESFDGEIFPVVVTGLSPNEIEYMMNSNNNSFRVVITEGQKVDKDLVFGTLKEVKSAIKSKGK